MSPGLTAAAGTAASSASAAATGAAATGAAVTVVASAHPALMLLVGAAMGVGVMTGVVVLRETPSPSPSPAPLASASASAARTSERLGGSATPASPPLELQPTWAAPAISSSPSAGPASVIDASKAPRAPRVARAAPSASPPLASLGEQQVLLDAARRALARSDGAGALEALSWHRARFPETAFGEEREALTIKALRASGSNGEARQRADAFVRRYPTSVFQEGVVEPPNP